MSDSYAPKSVKLSPDGGQVAIRKDGSGGNVWAVMDYQRGGFFAPFSYVDDWADLT